MQDYVCFYEYFSKLPIEEAATVLLGCRLVTPDCQVQIVEVEAYGGSDDPGSHAYRGKTPRNRIMYDRAGLLYMYFNYGVHWMANVTCNKEGDPSAVLLRAAKPLNGLETIQSRRPKAKSVYDLLSGPGKLAGGLGLDGSHYGIDLLDTDSPIRIEPTRNRVKVLTTKRIGLAPGKGDALLLRYIDADQIEWCSKEKR